MINQPYSPQTNHDSPGVLIPGFRLKPQKFPSLFGKHSSIEGKGMAAEVNAQVEVLDWGTPWCYRSGVTCPTGACAPFRQLELGLWLISLAVNPVRGSYTPPSPGLLQGPWISGFLGNDDG